MRLVIGSKALGLVALMLGATTACTGTSSGADDTDDGNPTSAEDCDNGTDDDNDGRTDCDDSDCDGTGACDEETPSERCANGQDDDGDGAIDCDDSDCVGDDACDPNEVEQDCGDGVDDDNDGDTDCDDSDCEGEPECTGTTDEDCNNGRDDDGDGREDCDDADCAGDPSCAGDTALGLAVMVGGNTVDTTSDKYVDGYLGILYTDMSNFPQAGNSLCDQLADWTYVGPTPSAAVSSCPQCSWTFTLTTENSTADGAYCSQIGVTDGGFDGIELPWAFSETYEYYGYSYSNFVWWYYDGSGGGGYDPQWILWVIADGSYYDVEGDASQNDWWLTYGYFYYEP